MFDTYLILSLLAWSVYWVAVATVDVGGTHMFGIFEKTLIEWGWLAAPAILLYAVGRKLWESHGVDLSRGDHVVYRMPKRSSQPSPNAEIVYASPHGESYAYYVPKLWTVVKTFDDGTVEVLTPGGKRHRIDKGDPLLHKAGMWEEFRLQRRFHKQFPPLERAA